MDKTTLVARSSHNSYEDRVTKQLFDGTYSADSVIVTLSVALSFYNCLEMFLLITTTFKKFKGLYFWSLLLCNLGVLLFALGMMLGYFDLCVLWLNKTVLDIGWVLMIVCQSLVLYSRLGLIYEDFKILQGVKWMIIFTSFTLLVPVVVLDFGNTYSPLEAFARGYYYIEHIQMTGVTLQELIISGMYVYKTVHLLGFIQRTNMRSMVWQLFAINVIIISMDIALIVLQFKHYQLYQETIKVFVYSVKLKLELNILSKLVDLVRGDTARRSMTLDVIDSNAIPGQAREEIHREMSLSKPHPTSDWLGSGENRPVETVDHDLTGQRKLSGTSPQSLGDDTDEISQVLSNQSEATSRTKGRESDLMYADMLRSMK